MMNSILTARIFVSLCLLMNILHVYQICEEYFRFDATTNVKISLPDEYEFPSLTLCFNLPYMIDMGLVSKKDRVKLLSSCIVSNTTPEEVESFASREGITFPDFDQEFKDKIETCDGMVSFFMTRFSIREAFKITKAVTDVVHYFSAHGNQTKALVSSNLSHFFSVTPFFLSGDKCFQMDLLPQYNTIIDVEQLSNNLFYIRTADDVKVVSYFPKPRFESITSKDPPLLVKNRVMAHTTYDVYRAELLEPPFGSKCRMYDRSKGIFSKRHCFRECVKDEAVRTTEEVPHEMKVTESDGRGKARFGLHSLNREWKDKCKDACKQKDCSSTLYFPRNLRKEPQPSNTGCYVQHYISQNPEISSEEQKAIPLISFLTNAFSTFGFWLGLSVFGSYGEIMKRANMSRWMTFVRKRKVGRVSITKNRNDDSNTRRQRTRLATVSPVDCD